MFVEINGKYTNTRFISSMTQTTEEIDGQTKYVNIYQLSNGVAIKEVFDSKSEADEKYEDVEKSGGGGSGGTSNYNDLQNKPSINNVELSGNKTSSDLGVQDALVSGTNIKTINNTSLLGSGDISIGNGGAIITDSNYSSQSTINEVNAEYQKYLNGESYQVYFNGKVDGSSTYTGTRRLYFEKSSNLIYLFSPLYWTLSQSNTRRLVAAKYFMCTISNGQVTSLGNPQTARVYLAPSVSSTLIAYDNSFEYTPTGDYNPATKKYVDDSIATAIGTALGGSY